MPKPEALLRIELDALKALPDLALSALCAELVMGWTARSKGEQGHNTRIWPASLEWNWGWVPRQFGGSRHHERPLPHYCIDRAAAAEAEHQAIESSGWSDYSRALMDVLECSNGGADAALTTRRMTLAGPRDRVVAAILAVRRGEEIEFRDYDFRFHYDNQPRVRYDD